MTLTNILSLPPRDRFYLEHQITLKVTVKHPPNYLPVFWNRKHPSTASTQPSGHTPGGAVVLHLGVVVVVSHLGVVVVSHLGVVVVVSHLGVVVVVSHLGVVVVVDVSHQGVVVVVDGFIH